MTHLRATDDSQYRSEAKYRNWDGYAQRRDNLDPFKDLLQRDGRVCDHCYMLRYEQLTFEWWRGSFGWSSFELFIPHEREQRHERFESGTANGIRLACGNCGRRGSKARPLAKEQLYVVADNISETLSEKGIEHDAAVLKREVRRRNTSANQGRQDSHVFAPATTIALEAEHDDLAAVIARYNADGES